MKPFRLAAAVSIPLLAAPLCAAANPAVHLVNASLASGPPVWGSAPSQTGWRATTLSTSLNSPTGMDFLGDGRALITGRQGSIWLATLSTGSLQAVSGFPTANFFTDGQGGLLDTALHPDFARNRFVYFAYTQGSWSRNRLAVGRAVLEGSTLGGFTQIFAVSQWKEGGQHFGSRLLFLPDGTLLVSVGDGGNPVLTIDGLEARLWAQRGASHLGKILRLTETGAAAAGNPFSAFSWARPEIWSFGHRNPQGLALDAATGRVWSSEHGAQGGDEINVVMRAQNYGWPRATHSREYWGDVISPFTALPGMISPRAVWTPAIAPSGLTVVSGGRFPAWRGDLLLAGMTSGGIRRVDLNASGWPVAQWHLEIGQRVRDITSAPDGQIYCVTDPGQLIRIDPAGA